MVWPLVVVVCAAASIGLLQRRNIAQLKHGIGTALSGQKLEDASEDYISQLPDEILANILSSLTVKEAVRTSILSRRWRHIFEHMPAVNVNWFVMSGAPDPRHVCHDCGHTYMFEGHDAAVCARYFNSFRINYERFLNTCKNRKLLSFEFSMCVERNPTLTDIGDLIDFVRNKDLDKLSLQFYCVDYHEQHHTKRWACVIQTSDLSGLSKLKQLRLHSTIFDFDSKVMFTSLVTLHLSYVRFLRDDVQCILFACSSLEEVRLEACVLPKKLYVGDNLHHLKILRISYCPGVEHVEVCAGSIKTFEFLGNAFVRFVFSEACNIENLLLKPDHGEMDIFGNLCADHPCLKKLSLFVPSSMVRQMPANPGTFCSIKTFELFICIQDDQSDLVKFLPSLLRYFPELQKLRVVMPWHSDWKVTEETHKLLKHKHLKDVEIGSFVGGKDQIRFAIYLLRSAVALEQMVLDKCVLLYGGYGNLSHAYERPLSAISRYFISKRLEKEAVSKSAKIIFR